MQITLLQLHLNDVDKRRDDRSRDDLRHNKLLEVVLDEEARRLSGKYYTGLINDNLYSHNTESGKHSH